jgi:hypothetical protein
LVFLRDQRPANGEVNEQKEQSRIGGEYQERAHSLSTQNTRHDLDGRPGLPDKDACQGSGRSIAIKEEQGSIIITVTAVGEEAAVNAWVDDYFVRYSPFGYDTRIDEREVLVDGSVQVIVKRYRSCE